MNCVFQDAMIGRLPHLVSFLQDEGVETIYLSFPWYLSDETSARMDAHVAAHFPWLAFPSNGRKPSWHSYKFRLDPDRLNALCADLAQINATSWRAKLRYNPALEFG